MICGGNAAVFVRDMDRAVAFYSETLGLKLRNRYGDEWAEIDAGGLAIGLHPPSAAGPEPGAAGAIQIGLNVTEPIAAVMKILQSRGVAFRGPVVDDGPVKLAFFADPDGNPLYLCEVGHE
ncbi:MAG: VOC family protein [Phycisphaerales bacterium JB039]